MKRRIVVLGSTGSVGVSALDVARQLPDALEVVAIAAGSSWKQLAAQADQFPGITHVALSDTGAADALRDTWSSRAHVLAGPESLSELVEAVDADLVLNAVVGAAGLPATVATVERGLDLALANKESLVMAGARLMPRAAETGSTLLPVDSEHSALFQALRSGTRAEVHKMFLTASGGPFRTWSREEIEAATLEDALNHPTWDMGPKITIDSATMVNKALEIIEAKHLFDLDADQIDVIVHPESIIHSVVEFRDGSMIAQVGTPDMRTPIQYALTFPQRYPACAERLDWKQLRQLNFEPPDPERFPALELGLRAAREGGLVGAVFNAANEAAVEAFRAGRLRFCEIVPTIQAVVDRHTPANDPTYDELFAADRWARDEVATCLT